jgi:signal transduction histidine kinase
MARPGPSTEDGRRAGEGRTVLRTAVHRFEVAVLLALAVLAVGTVGASRQVAHREALRDARLTATRVAEDVAATHVDHTVRAGGETSGRRRLDRALRAEMSDHVIEHIRLWSSTGTVLWSDRASEVGRTYRLSPEVQRLFGTRRSLAEPSHESSRRGGEVEREELVEVYVGAVDTDGDAFVFESYTWPEALQDNTAIIFWEFVWVGLGSLVLFAAATVPMAVSAARRVDKGQRQRSEVLRQALRESRHERRRLAQDVHDGVIQDLAAAGYALSSVLSRLPSDADSGELRQLGARVSELLVTGVAELRSLATDLLPPDLTDADLLEAIQELVVRCRSAGVDVQVSVAEGVSADPDVLAMVHRCVREALRNVVKHAGATRVSVVVGRDRDVVTVCVTDDGRGPARIRHDEYGHMGLRLLTEMLRELGGDLALVTADGGGASFEVTMPAALAD